MLSVIPIVTTKKIAREYTEKGNEKRILKFHDKKSNKH